MVTYSINTYISFLHRFPFLHLLVSLRKSRRRLKVLTFSTALTSTKMRRRRKMSNKRTTKEKRKKRASSMKRTKAKWRKRK